MLRLGAALGRDGRLAEASQAFRGAAAILRGPGAPVKVPALDAVVLRDSFHGIVERRPNLAERFYEVLFARRTCLWSGGTARIEFHRNGASAPAIARPRARSSLSA
jgi:hypothetical protein